MTLKDRLRQGEPLIGCFQRIPAPEITELVAYAGLDFVVIGATYLATNDVRLLLGSAQAFLAGVRGAL